MNVWVMETKPGDVELIYALALSPRAWMIIGNPQAFPIKRASSRGLTVYFRTTSTPEGVERVFKGGLFSGGKSASVPHPHYPSLLTIFGLVSEA